MKSILLTTAIAALFFTGCTHRIGNMTAVSTNNIDGLKAEVTSETRVFGESCNHVAIIIPFGDFQNRLQIATDNAIDNGHKNGIKGDTVINAKIDVNSWYIPLIYGRNCMQVKGDLIQMSASMK